MSDLICPLYSQQVQKHFATNEDLRHMGTLSEPRLSPDGRSVLLQVTDSTAEGAKSHLWLLEIATKTYRQLTYSPEADKRGEHSAMWMPDGESVLFLAHRGEHTQVFLLPMHGGEAKPFGLKTMPPADASKLPGALPPAKDAKATRSATDEDPASEQAVDSGGELPLDVDSFAPAPDGKTIAVLAMDPQTPGEKKQGEAKADATWVDHNLHGTRLYLLDVASGKLTLAAVPFDVHSFAWAPDSMRLAAVVEEPDNLGDLHPAAHTWLVTAADPAHPVALDALPATTETVRWSVDGKSLVYLAQAAQDGPPGYSDLYRIEVASQTIHNLTDGLKGTLSHEAPVPLLNGAVFALAFAGTRSYLAEYDADRKSAKVLESPLATVQAVDTNEKQTGWVFLGQSGSEPPTVYFSESLSAMGPKETSKVVALGTPPTIPPQLQALAPKLLQWKSDGLSIEGLLYLPPESSLHRVPLVVDVHGGPLGAFEDKYDPFVDFLLGHGWAVLRTNPRGSTNYGVHFAAANKNDLGGGDYRDIMAGVDYALATEPLDADRMALIGYSYGGEMAGFVEGRTSRFKAIISAAPVIDQYSEYGTEASSWYDRWYFGKPWEKPVDAWRQSPLSLVHHARTPMLLLQGDADTTDPLGQSQEFYRALRQAGVPVDLITYPRENHGPLAGGIFGAPSSEPWHGFDARQRIAAFLEKHLQTSP